MVASLSELLVGSRQLLPIQVEEAERAADALGVSLASILLERGILHEDVLLQLVQAHQLLPVYAPEKETPTSDALHLLSQQEAERMLVLPLTQTARQLVVVMVDPLDARLLEELVFLTGREIFPVLGRYSEVMQGIHDGYRRIATKVMKPEPEDVLGGGFAGELGSAQLDTQPEHESIRMLARRLEALVQVLVDKGLVSREELLLTQRDLGLDDADE